MSDNNILVTGAAGFIGFHLAKRILESNPNVNIIGFDNINDYYNVKLKETRLEILRRFPNFKFIKGDLSDKKSLERVFTENKLSVVINLAAQAGVRYSITNPDVYINSNIVGFFNILEACRSFAVKYLIYASSSSVYGANQKVPYSVGDKTDKPVSLYAATKKSNELLAYSYSQLYDISMTGIRFFTVYGEYGRPDMAYFSFTEKMIRGETVSLFNNGDMYRNFTYIDDIVTGIVKIMKKLPVTDDNGAKHKIYNIGNNSPVSVVRFTEILEDCLMKTGVITRRVVKEFLPAQKGEVYKTFADVTEIRPVLQLAKSR